MAIKTYIVRIFRKEDGKKPILVGDLEVAGADGRTTFHSQEELCRSLCGKEEVKPGGSGKSKKRETLNTGIT